MAKCIVCKAYFEHGGQCPRCETNNRPWMVRRKNEPVEQEGLSGLLAFTAPHAYMPFAVTALATFFGLLSLFTLWSNIKPGFRALALLMTPAGCLLSVQGIYEMRMQIRESELLREVQQGQRLGLSAKMITLLLPAMAAGLVLALTLLLVKIDVFWELVKWLALTEAQDTGNSLPEKFLAVLPFVSMIGYIALATSFTASSSLMLARCYINRLDEIVPGPIFLQEHLLVKVVQREAERAVRRPETPSVIEVNRQQAPRSWTWDEIEKMDDGGVRLTAIVKAKDQGGNTPMMQMAEDVTYVIESDPWSRITKIERQ